MACPVLDSDVLVGSTDIVARLGLKRIENLHYYVKHDPTFPQPLGNIRGALLWSWPDVEDWARTKRFRRRTPPVHAPRSKDFEAAMERLAGELGLDPAQAVDLVGVYEIAHRLKFERTMSVHRFRRDKTSGFPAAVARIDPSRATWIWWWPDVEKWAEEHYPERIKAWREILSAEQSTGNENGEAPAAPAEEQTVKKAVGATKAAKKKTATKKVGTR